MTELNLHKFITYLKIAIQKNDFQFIDKSIEILKKNEKNELIITSILDYITHILFINSKLKILSSSQIFLLIKKISIYITMHNFPHFYNAILKYKNTKKLILHFLSFRTDYKDFFIFIDDKHITAENTNCKISTDLLIHYVNRNRPANKKHKQIVKILYNDTNHTSSLIRLFTILKYEFKFIIKYKFYRFMNLNTLNMILRKIKNMNLTYTNLLVAQKIYSVKYYNSKDNKGREKFVQLIMTSKKFTYPMLKLYLHNINELEHIKFFLNKIIEIPSNENEYFELSNFTISFIKKFIKVFNELIYVNKERLVRKFIFDIIYLKRVGQILKSDEIDFFTSEYDNGRNNKIDILDKGIVEDLIKIYYAEHNSTLKEKYIKKKLCKNNLHNLMHRFMQNNIFSKLFLFSRKNSYKVQNIDRAYAYINNIILEDGLEFTYREYNNYKKYGKYFSNFLPDICNLYEPSYYLFMLINYYISKKLYILDSIDIYSIILKYSLNAQYFEILTGEKLIFDKIDNFELSNEIFPLYNLNFYFFDLTFQKFSIEYICKILCIILNYYDVKSDFIFLIKKGLKRKIFAKSHSEIFYQYVSYLYMHKILTHD